MLVLLVGKYITNEIDSDSYHYKEIRLSNE